MALFGKYEILDQFGSGTMGAVYRARDSLLEREVAIKILHEIHATDPELKERFYREARACARLRHPGIVMVHDFGENEGNPFMVMELLRGEDLRALLASGRRLPAETRLELMAQVCDALGHAHRAGIVHRDVKPSNIFIEENGRAKVLDFGIARLASSELTRTGRALGTPDYMAPEQILGRTCDARSDIFSAAIVTFEFLTGTHPFRGESIPRRIVQGEPEALAALAPDLPAEVEIALRTALEKEPAARQATAEELAAALRSAAEAMRSRPQPDDPFRAAMRDLPEEIGMTATIVRKFEPDAVAAVAADEALETTRLMRPEERLPPPEDADFAATRLMTPRQPVAADPAPEVAPQAASRRKRRKARAAAAVFATLLVTAGAGAAAIYYFYPDLNPWRRTASALAPPARVLAAARVTADAAAVYDVPDSSERRLARLGKGEGVDIVRLPQNKFQEWVAVQVPVRGETVQGYVRLAALGDWRSDEPAAALALLRLFGDTQPEAQIGAIDGFLAWAEKSPAAAAARYEKGSQYLLLARDAARTGRPAETTRGYLEHARAEFAAAAADPRWKSPVTRAREALESLTPREPAPPPANSHAADRAAPPRASVRRADLANVESLWMAGRYNEAMQETYRYLQQHPGDPAGQEWREKIARARRVEDASRK